MRCCALVWSSKDPSSIADIVFGAAFVQVGAHPCIGSLRTHGGLQRWLEIRLEAHV